MKTTTRLACNKSQSISLFWVSRPHWRSLELFKELEFESSQIELFKAIETLGYLIAAFDCQDLRLPFHLYSLSLLSL